MSGSNRTHTEEDAALVGQARQGDDQAFAQLVNRHWPLIRADVYRRLGCSTDADDVTQETFVAAYRHLGDLADSRKFGQWLRVIAANAANKYLAQRVLGRQRFAHPASLDHIAWNGDTEADPPATAEALRQAMDVLQPDDRAVTTMFYLLGFPQSRIAQILGIPEGTVKSRLHRARNQLKRRWTAMNAQQTRTGLAEDYSRAVIEGMRGVIHWQKLLPDEGLDGWTPGRPENWSRDGDVIIGESHSDTGCCLTIGDASWADYELSVLVTVISGANAQIPFRRSENGKHFYFFDMMFGWQVASITMGNLETREYPRKLSVVNFPFEHGREYDVMIAARGSSLTTYIDGKLVNQLTDATLPTGPIALAVWHSKTAFRDPRIRHMT